MFILSHRNASPRRGLKLDNATSAMHGSAILRFVKDEKWHESPCWEYWAAGRVQKLLPYNEAGQ